MQQEGIGWSVEFNSLYTIAASHSLPTRTHVLAHPTSIVHLVEAGRDGVRSGQEGEGNSVFSGFRSVCVCFYLSMVWFAFQPTKIMAKYMAPMAKTRWKKPKP